MKDIIVKVAARARARRAAIFRSSFELGPGTKVLDLGGLFGDYMHSLMAGTTLKPSNVYIADIYKPGLTDASSRYGFVGVPLEDSGPLPFPDKFFDVVFCSSVIEHVTVPRKEIWTLRSGKEFRRRALLRQQEFADEIRRIARQYYVQTPHPGFPIESHSWVPFFNLLPRPAMFPAMVVINRLWIKTVEPDWNLLNAKEMGLMFPESKITVETFAGLPKSIMAISSDRVSIDTQCS